MERREQTPGLNSAAQLMRLASNETVEIPPFINLKPEAAALWPQFSRARPRDHWREFDLILLSKVCNLEADIRKNQEVLDRTGPIIQNKKGTPVANPLVSIIDTLTRQQMAIIRSLSLNQGAGDSRLLNAHGLKAANFAKVIEDDEDGLLARPD